MYIETKNAIPYNSGIKGSTTGIVRGIIKSFSWVKDWTVVLINYEYQTTEGVVLESNSLELDATAIDELDATIEPLIEGKTYREREECRAYLRFTFQMAETFEISQAEIVLTTPVVEPLNKKKLSK